ncbi:16S rRNA (cytidine(1402)-2'-O)-methyltransferase [Williamsia sterculiae]|uniref:Ribosomal RNA small subunit methyltransferase I n=1 Tax=Williamsia sterculiae TaxID=1344003 RepID=A0A1N7DND7_9NOCA|nr:16S rRNA (cytidine(1402)-2'-O)-methyltransferase [Williamsia sterculiae]SIR77248.1 16S rRNA (cytidine1402-2'-O)-methyltransferase [Williamsia sterculiae]
MNEFGRSRGTDDPDGSSTGKLLVAATPMGRFDDASPRLREALACADVVAAEDTRRALNLAGGLGVTVSGRIVSYYDQVEAGRTPTLVADIRGGATVLLISDAGMPSVSDPGYRLVAATVEAGLAITCLPGPSAVTTAVALSGLPVERFCFDGFAPRKPGRRRRWLLTLVAEERAVVFFESPHRIADTLTEAVEVLGPDRRGAVCRELTKVYEEVRRGTLAELAEWSANGLRGEVTVVFAGADAAEADPEDLVDEVQQLVDSGERLKDACAAVAQRHGASKRELYQAVLAARDD